MLASFAPLRETSLPESQQSRGGARGQHASPPSPPGRGAGGEGEPEEPIQAQAYRPHPQPFSLREKGARGGIERPFASAKWQQRLHLHKLLIAWTKGRAGNRRLRPPCVASSSDLGEGLSLMCWSRWPLANGCPNPLAVSPLPRIRQNSGQRISKKNGFSFESKQIAFVEYLCTLVRAKRWPAALTLFRSFNLLASRRLRTESVVRSHCASSTMTMGQRRSALPRLTLMSPKTYFRDKTVAT
jgi:hypothetical protein